MNRIIGTLLSAIVAVAVFAFTAFRVMPALTSVPTDDGVNRASLAVTADGVDSSPGFDVSSSVNDVFFVGQSSADETSDHRENGDPVTKPSEPEIALPATGTVHANPFASE